AEGAGRPPGCLAPGPRTGMPRRREPPPPPDRVAFSVRATRRTGRRRRCRSGRALLRMWGCPLPASDDSEGAPAPMCDLWLWPWPHRFPILDEERRSAMRFQWTGVGVVFGAALGFLLGQLVFEGAWW